MAKQLNNNLHKAKVNKNDEFYTQLVDIENELKHYKEHFKGKTVYCNCDDPQESNFWKYFSNNFEHLELKKLVSTHFHSERTTYKLEITKDFNGDGKINNLDTIKTPLKQNGDFRSDECVQILKEADIVVTNPPFSLFREYVSQLAEHGKKFLIIGNQNAITYKEIFKLIKENKLWLGYRNGDMAFKVPAHYEERGTRSWVDESGQNWRSLGNGSWFTNLDHNKRHEDLILYKKYTPEEYPHYDNYNAINVDKTKDIPADWSGAMGVPITFLDKFNPNQFEIIGLSASAGYKEDIVGLPFLGDKDARPLINGKNTYARVFIKHKKI